MPEVTPEAATLRRDERAGVYRSPGLLALGLPHAFTTRRGGLDVGPLDAPDEAGATLAARLVDLAGAPDGVTVEDLQQVHGDRVVEAPQGTGLAPTCADGLCTERADRLLLIRSADCVPVLVARRDGRRVAAVHAGWRGLVAGVIPRALEQLGAGEHVAAIGPSICARCFEVGPEVVEAFERVGLGGCVQGGGTPRRTVDLAGAAAEQLRQGGVRAIDRTDRCTYHHADEFYSHRREVTHGDLQRTGRLAALIAPRAISALDETR